MKLEVGKQYWVQQPGDKEAILMTYHGFYPGDYPCDVCRRDGWTKKGWSGRHFFATEDERNQLIVGSECIKKCKINLPIY